MGKKSGPVLRFFSFHDIQMAFSADTVTVDAELDPPGSAGWTLFSVDVRYQTEISTGNWSTPPTAVGSVQNESITPPGGGNTHWRYHCTFASPTGDGTTKHRVNLQANWTGAASEAAADNDSWVPPPPPNPIPSPPNLKGRKGKSAKKAKKKPAPKKSKKK